MNVKAKLFLMVGLPILALAFILVYVSNNFNTFKKDIATVGNLQKDTSVLLQSYQNMTVAYTATINALHAEDVESLNALVDVNAQNINQAIAAIESITGHFSSQMIQDFSQFSSEYAQWKQSNDSFFALSTDTIAANIERDKGIVKARESFANMRKITEQLSQLISKKLEDPAIDQERREKLKDAQLNVLQGDRSAYQAYVTHLEILNTTDIAKANELAKVFQIKFKEARDLLIQGVHPLGKDGDKLKINFAIMFQLWSSFSKKTIELHTSNMAKNIARTEEFKKAETEFFSLQKGIKNMADGEAAYVGLEFAKMHNAIDDFITMYKTVAVSCIIFSILITLLFARSITDPLKKTLKMAASIADGDFSTTFAIRQKDEVGQVARAVQRIPETLIAFQNELKKMSGTIDAGWLRHRGDPAPFPGAYGELMTDVNAVAELYTGFLDTVPMPLLTLDTDYSIRFMNKNGAGLSEFEPEALDGKKCYDIFRTSDCKTENCACSRAMRSLSQQSSETDAHPKAGDLEIKYIGVPNFLRDGTLAGSFEMVIDQTETMRSHKKMLEIAGRSAEIAERLSSASDEISAQVDESSKGAEMQRDRSTETASAMEEMNATVLEVAQNASDAAGNAEDARSKALEGADIVKQVVEAISRVQEQAEGLRENMSQLGDQAQDIGRIMNVISDIADQTNLLALNAAIEAARAGEAGRGFAVVADEVRKLAEKTMQATFEVEKAINNIQSGAKHNVEGTVQAVAAVAESTSLAEKAGESLANILRMSETTADQVRNIATAAEQQSATAEEITHAAEQIHRISSDTAEGMVQSSQAVYELARLAGELRVIIDELQGQRG